MDGRFIPDRTGDSGGYRLPVDILFTLGPGDADADVWPDYRALGLDEGDISELRRLTLDPRLHLADPAGPAARAPWHACAALVQLGAARTFPPPQRVPLPGDEGWRCPALLLAAAAIGPPAIPALRAALEEVAAGAEARILAAEALGAVILSHPPGRGTAIAALTASLDRAEGCDRAVDDHIAFVLTALDAVEAHASVMRAVAAGGITPWWRPRPPPRPPHDRSTCIGQSGVLPCTNLT